MPSRQDRSEVERLRAALAAERAERERLADKLAEVLDHVYAANALPATAGGETGPLPRVPGQRSHRVPREQRWLRAVPGLTLPAGLGAGLRATGAAFRAHRVAAAKLAAVSMAGGAVLAAAPFGPSHHLEFITPYAAARVPSAAPVAAVPFPQVPVRLIASTTAHPKAALLSRKPPAKPVAVPAPSPVPDPAPAPVLAVTAPPSQPQDASWSGSSQPSPSSQLSQPLDLQARGRHAGPDSLLGGSGYRGRHGGNGQSGIWQNASGQLGNWQGGQQQGGNWHGSGGGGYGQRGGY